MRSLCSLIVFECTDVRFAGADWSHHLDVERDAFVFPDAILKGPAGTYQLFVRDSRQVCARSVASPAPASAAVRSKLLGDGDDLSQMLLEGVVFRLLAGAPHHVAVCISDSGVPPPALRPEWKGLSIPTRAKVDVYCELRDEYDR